MQILFIYFCIFNLAVYLRTLSLSVHEKYTFKILNYVNLHFMD